MSTAARIRSIDKSDLATVRDLAMIIWPRLYRHMVSPVQMDAILSALFDLDTLEDDIDLRGHVYWLAEVGTKATGFASASLEDGRIHVYKIYVREDYRGFGIGKALMQAALERFSGAHSLSLIVPQDHDQGQGFALHSGFRFDRSEPVNIAGYELTNHIMIRPL